eukprot:GHVR01121729.1.p1 GENE.GHVR01121729.1~~GHVR01121729.1.p1  ORF type:complete len:238 (+),score=51.87 GHVR01121729.1:79-792(+)
MYLRLIFIISIMSMISLVSVALFFLSSNNIHQVKAKVYPPVTCGSAIHLEHSPSNFYLFSHSIQWGAGSGQQAVTAVDDRDTSTMWIVKESHGDPICPTGKPVKCGSKVRLEHISTQRNLHSHEFPGAVTKNYEVCGYGEKGEGDAGDNFSVLCVSGDFWRMNEKVRLKHVSSKGFLRASQKDRFTHNNCPRCPIVGHLEVTVSKKPQGNIPDELWVATEAVSISISDEDDDAHDEL